MKRARISNANSKTDEVSHILTPYSGSSFSDLPRDILLNILVRMSIKSIVVSKCVCKTWHDLVSNPEFKKLHFDQAEVYPLIQTYGSKLVHLVQPDKDDFELKLGMCDHTHTKPGCISNVRVKIDIKLKILERYRLMNVQNTYGLVTCNGLLCLSYPVDKRTHPPIVCNPITGEFIKLPEAKEIDFDEVHHLRYGFGFSPLTNQYKVLRMFQNYTAVEAHEAHIHILGTKTWKSINFSTRSMPKSSPTYLNGFLYWPSRRNSSSVCSFHIEKECFGSISAPAIIQPYQHYNMGVLGGELCLCGVLESYNFDVWTMKDNRTGKAWSKVFSFRSMRSVQIQDFRSLLPIKYLNNGAILMFALLKKLLCTWIQKKIDLDI